MNFITSMHIAIDTSPLNSGHFLQHRVRGTGVYLGNLKRSLLEYDSDNEYIFFTRGEKLPKDTDIVHYPYFEPFFRTLPLFKKYKMVVTVHDLTPLVFADYFPKGIKGEIKWQMQRYFLQKADAVITDSKCSKDDIIKYAGVDKNKVHVVYLAAGEAFKQLKIAPPRSGKHSWGENLKLKISKKYSLPENFLLYVGDVTWNKNLPRLLEAVQKTNIPLVMVGKALVNQNFNQSNPWNQDLNEVNRLIVQQSDNGTMKQFIRLGFVPDEDLVALYNVATVFVMPSLYEGFGLPILEAMSCGTPVIVSKEGSIPEVAGDAAFYVNAYDVKNIALGIEKVFKDKKLQKELQTRGLIQAKKFSWQKTVEETVRVYEKVIRF